MRSAFAANSVVFSGSRLLRVDSLRPEISQIVLVGDKGEEFVSSFDEFHERVARGQYRWVSNGATTPIAEIPVRHLTKTERCALDQRLELLELVRRGRNDEKPWSAIIVQLDEYCRTKGIAVPNLRTLQRWRKADNFATATDQLAPFYSARGNKRLFKTLEDLDFEETVADEIYQRFCSTDKFNVSQLTKLVNDRCRKRAEERNMFFKGISRRSVGRRVKALTQTLLASGRVDKNTYAQEMRGAIQKFVVERPYERVEVDATPLDVFCCDGSGKIIGRPTCYAGIDAATGAIVTIKCSIQKPSQDFVLSALEFCFSPKGEEFRQKYKLKHPWLAPTSLESIVLDNAQEHHGGVVLNALRYLNTVIDYPMAGKPQAKPYIERFFGTLKAHLINTCPGSVVSQSKMEKDPIGRAMTQNLYTVAELEALIIRWVADVYMQTPSPRLESRFGVGTSPAQAMALLKQQYVVLPPPNPEEFRAACLRYHSKELTLSRVGISFDTMTYHSRELDHLYKELGMKRKVQVRYYPLDCLEIFVVDPRNRDNLIVARNREPAMPLISFEEARAIRKSHRKSDAALSGEEYQAAHVRMLRENHAKAKSGKVGDRNRAARQAEREAHRQQQLRERVVQDSPSVALSAQNLVAAPRRKKMRGGDSV